MLHAYGLDIPRSLDEICDRYLGYIPVAVRDACGAGHAEAAERSIAGLAYSGDAVLTDVESICAIFARLRDPARDEARSRPSRGTRPRPCGTRRRLLRACSTP